MTQKTGLPGPNRLKISLSEGRPQIGLWCSLSGNIPAELVAGAGFDWLLIDNEHTPNDLPLTLAQLQAVAPYPVEPIVRLPSQDPVLVKQYLDAGARSLLFPMVDSADQAAAVVAATRYPPHGLRGFAGTHRANRFGRVKDYAATVGNDLCVIVQIESAAALESIEAIAAIDGVDALFIGPNDLAASLGHLGKAMSAEVQATISDAGRRIVAAGKAAGVLMFDEARAQELLDEGFTLVGVGSDINLLRDGADGLASRFADGGAGRS